MWDAALELVVFAVKLGLVVVGVTIVIGMVLANVRGHRTGTRNLLVRSMNEALEHARDQIRAGLMTSKAWKRFVKKRKKEQAGKEEPERRVFVLDFEGDITASAVSELRALVTALLGVVESGDEVVVRLDSPGGLVPQYGLAASQLARVRARKVPLTVCVDRIAASGGYLMACEADRIVAAPFAIIGSIGVVAPVPNLHRLLTSYGVDYEEVTAGQFKRTVSLLGEISEEGRKKFREQLEDVHVLFKDAVARNRKDLDIDRVATGEYWFGARAVDLKLVDEVRTSDDYLLERLEGAKLVHLELDTGPTLRERMGLAVSGALDGLLLRWLTRLWSSRYAA
jgi:serine protease SohB